MTSATDEADARFMSLALRAAARGRPSPNPHVGAVLVRRGAVVATGHHRRAGEPHAEVMAIERAGRLSRGATLYVTFEPCNHHGRTGPCTEAILRAGIARVVVGCRDPAPHAPGATARLRRGGVEVRLGVRKQEATRLVEDFTKHFTTGIPFVTLKAALTLDGRLATRSGDSRWITGEEARKRAHRMRDRSDAVLVGIGTVLADDPALTVRHVRGRDPLRAVVDARLRTPAQARILRGASERPPILFHGPRAGAGRRRALRDAGAELVEVPEGRGGLRLRAVLRELGRRDVVRLLVEGGATLNGSLLAGRLVDRAAIFLAPRILGDPRAIPLAHGPPIDRIADALRLRDVTVERCGEDVLVEGALGPRPARAALQERRPRRRRAAG